MSDVPRAIEPTKHSVYRVGIVGIEDDPSYVLVGQVSGDIGENHPRWRTHCWGQRVSRNEYLPVNGYDYIITVSSGNVHIAGVGKGRECTPSIASVLALPKILI